MFDRNDYMRQWRSDNPERLRLYRQKSKNRDKLYMRGYRMKNPDKNKIATKKWRDKNKEVAKSSCNNWNKKNPEKVGFAAIKARCKSKGLKLDITFEEYLDIIRPMLCSVTGVKLSWDWDGEFKNPWAPSIDRIDPNTGYINGNMRLVCWSYNLAKGQWSDAVVQKWARNIQ